MLLVDTHCGRQLLSRLRGNEIQPLGVDHAGVEFEAKDHVLHNPQAWCGRGGPGDAMWLQVKR